MDARNLLDPPLDRAWSTSLGEVIRMQLRPCGPRIVAAAGNALVALTMDDGTVVWRYEAKQSIVHFAVGSEAILLASEGTGGRDVLTCLGLDGVPRWTRSEWSLASDCLRADGNRFLVVGAEPADPESTFCRLVEAKDGAAVLQFPCPPGAPEPVGGGYVYSVRSLDPASSGLYFHDPARGSTERLFAAAHETRVVSGGTVVIDTQDWDVMPSELVCLDVASKTVRWTGTGGPNVRLAADRRQIAAVEAHQEGRFVLVIRDLESGDATWRSGEIVGSTAYPILLSDIAGVVVDLDRLELFARWDGTPRQSITARMFASSLATQRGIASVNQGSIELWRNTAK